MGVTPCVSVDLATQSPGGFRSSPARSTTRGVLALAPLQLDSQRGLHPQRGLPSQRGMHSQRGLHPFSLDAFSLLQMHGPEASLVSF